MDPAIGERTLVGDGLGELGAEQKLPRIKNFLIERMARAQRFAQTMNTEADRRTSRRWRRTIEAD